MHVDPNSPYAAITKRQQEVLDRLERGMGAKQIATDIGISRNAVYQTIDRLRRQGALSEDYTPSGQPPRGRGGALPAPRRSALGELRAQAAAGDGETAEYARLIEGAIASADVPALAYELGRLDALGESALASELVVSALRRLSALAPVDGSEK